MDVLWMQKADSGDPDIEYTAADFRAVFALFSEGVVDKAGGDFEVSVRGAGANLSVDVAAGRAIVEGDDTSDQGSYLVSESTTTNVTGFSAAPGTGGRIDLVVLQVNDPQAGGDSGSDASFEVVTGTPGSSPSAPSVPDSAIVLAEVRLDAGDVSIGGGGGSSGTITDRRVQATGIGGGVPVGSISMYAGSSAPTGWLLCQGQAVSRTDYADLYAVLGTSFGSGDGSTTFNLPDLRQRFPVGAQASTDYDLGETGGAASVTLTEAQLPAHDHGVQAALSSPGTYSPGADAIQTTGSVAGLASTALIDTNDVGSGDSIDIRPKFVALNFIVKAA